MLLSEDLVYIGTKLFLRNSGWLLLAGQPPSGTDHLPVIESKSPTRKGLGSSGAFKPDLVAYRDHITLLIECKPSRSAADLAKLRTILSDSARVTTLYEELVGRNLLRRHRLALSLEDFCRGLRGAIAHSGVGTPEHDILVISGVIQQGRAAILLPTLPDPTLARAFLGDDLTAG